MSVPSYSVRHPVTTLMVFLAIVMIGVFCLVQFPIDQLPNADIPALTVVTTYEGAAPGDVETKVTKILEDTLSAIPDLKHITSISAEGISKIILSFEWQTDLDTRANDARDAIDKAKTFLPSDVDPPRVLKFNLADFPILIFGVRAGESYPSLEKVLKDYVADPLKRIPGVALAAVITPLERQVNVYADRERLAAYSLTPQDVVRALAAENQDISAGNVKSGDTDYIVRVPGEFKDVEPMKDIVLAVRNGSTVRLGDVATVEDHFKEQTQYVTVDGQPGAAIIVRKQSGANTVQVAKAVKRRLPELMKRLPPDIRIIPVMDTSRDIERMINNLVTTLWQGAGLAVLVVLIFLRRWRATAIIALAIPYSLLLALVAMFFLKYTINMMTLFGLIIAVGMVVDNAIVILENITRHREEGEGPAEGAIYGTTEVGLAVAASTLTTVCIFFPILFIKGITKIFFGQFAMVASIALLGSLLSAMTLTPMLASVLLRGERFVGKPTNRFFQMTESWFEAVESAYASALGWALTHRKTVVFGAAGIFAASLLVVPQLGTEFMPKEDQNSIRGAVYMPVGTRVETTRRVMKRLDEILREEIKPEERVATYTRCGMSAGFSAAMQEEDSHIGNFSVRLVPPEQRRRSDREIASILRKKLTQLKTELGIDKFTIETTDIMSSMIMGGERPLTVNILGDDLEETDRLAAEIRWIAANVPGAVDISISREKARPELQIAVDRAKAAQLGLNVSAIGDAARASFYGRTASKYRVRGDEYDVFVKLREEDRSAPEDVAALPVRLPNGALIRADNIGEVRREFGPVRIDRKDQTRVVNVTGDVYGRALGDVVKDIEREVAKLDIPPGIEIQMAGQAEEQRESFFWLSTALLIGTVLVYMVMAGQFESLIDPFVVMFSVPFAFTGVIWSLWLRGYHISIIVFLGLLLLVGTVVNNAIVLVDYIGILRARGQSMMEAVRNAGRTRLRPVLMTALTTIVALLPMAFQRGQGAEVWNPLGTTVAGGLLVSTLVTLILVPTMYSLFETHVKRTRESAKEVGRVS
jgi:hydrophobe/amphiphile efflux-1 (HAE1) family protein